MTHDEVQEIVEKAVSTTLEKLGIEPGDHKEMQADFVHLRKWRKSVEQAQSFTFVAVLGSIVTGALGALWLGLKVMLGK